MTLGTTTDFTTAIEETVSEIGPKLAKARAERGWSLQQLGTRAGLSAAAVHKIEKGGIAPTIATLMKPLRSVDLATIAYRAETTGSGLVASRSTSSVKASSGCRSDKGTSGGAASDSTPASRLGRLAARRFFAG